MVVGHLPIDTQSKYLAGLRRLLRDGAPFDPLKHVIRARLEGRREPVQGLISPPLGRNELDTGLLLLHLYDQLRLDQEWPAQEQLRRVVTELLEEALTSGNGFQAIDRLGQLVGAFKVRRSDLLAGRLRTWLWGHLEIGLPRPREALIELTGDDLIRARQVLDLWLAVTPPLPPDWPQHYAGKIRSFFDGAVSILNGRRDRTLDQATFHLLTLLYRELLKLYPEYAGLQYPVLTDLAYRGREQGTEAIWLSLCWEYGILLGADPKWRRRFAQGLKGIGGDEKRRYRDPLQSALNAFFHRGLEYLDHLEQDLYPSEPTSIRADLKLVDKPLPAAGHPDRSDSEPYPDRLAQNLYLPGSAPPQSGLKIADEPQHTAAYSSHSDSQVGNCPRSRPHPPVCRRFYYLPRPTQTG